MSFFMMKKFKKMKDIGVELPAGLEDIKQETNIEGLPFDCNGGPRLDNDNQNQYLTVSDEQEQSLLRNRMESGSSQSTDNSSGYCEYNEAVDDSESEQQNDDDSTAQTISESLDLTNNSPTPLIPISSVSLLEDPSIVPAVNPPVKPVTPSNYVSEAFLRSQPAVTVPQPTGYTSWSAAIQQPYRPPVEEPKVKTPVVATTDIQGISGYVTHKQLSDFGQLIQ